MAIFEEESNASQDGNYREHLNRNWHNGNTEFDKVEGLLNTLEENLNNYRDEIHQLQESFNNLKEQHTQDNHLSCSCTVCHIGFVGQSDRLAWLVD